MDLFWSKEQQREPSVFLDPEEMKMAEFKNRLC